MARVNKETRDTIVAAMNDHLISISEKEEVELEFQLVDDGINSELRLICKKPSKSGGLKRKLEFKDGIIQVDMT